MSAGQLVRTLRIRTRRKVGNLGRVTTALGDAGVAIGEIVTLRIGHNYTLRDFHLNLDDEEHLKQAIASIDAIPDSEVVEVVNEVETVHCGGKIRTVSKIDLSDHRTHR